MKILMICTAFAPENEIGCVRTTKLAKYLVREGYDLTVISPTIIEGMVVSDSLMCEEIEQINHIHVSYSKWFQKYFFRKRNALTQSGTKAQMRSTKTGLKARLFKLAERVYTFIRVHDWYCQVKKKLRHEKRNSYDLVFSSYPSLSAHYAALYAKKKGIAKKWIADFRDPIAIDSIDGEQKNKKAVRQQSRIVRFADCVTHVSRRGTEQFVCNARDRHKLVWLPNGFDEEDFGQLRINTKNVERNQLVFSYAGGLYSGERDCSPLFQAISELINEGKLTYDGVRFDYAGKDYIVLKKQAEQFAVESVICDRGLLSRNAALEMQAASDCVVVATTCYVDHGGAMTGKIYEPVMMRRPILLLVRGNGLNSEPGAFIRDMNAGVVFEESADHGDVAVIRDMIMNMIREKQRTGQTSSSIDEDKRTVYTYKGIGQRLVQIIQKM